MLKLSNYRREFIVYLAGVVLLLVSVYLQNSYTTQKDDHRKHDYRHVQEVVHKKERILLNNVLLLSGRDALNYDVQEMVRNFGQQEQVYIQAYRNDTVLMWNNSQLDLERNLKELQQGLSVKKCANGWYMIYRINRNETTYVSYYLLQKSYSIHNNYFQDDFNADLKLDQSGSISLAAESGFLPVTKADGSTLFFLHPGDGSPDIPLTYRLLAAFSILLFLYGLFRCSSIYLSSHLLPTTAFEIANLLLLRFLNIHFHFPDFVYNLDFFKSTLYASSALEPSLGDLLLNCLLLFLIASRIRLLLKQLQQKAQKQVLPFSKIRENAGLLIIVLSWIGITEFVLNIIQGLITDSSFPYDVNMIYLTGFAYFCASLIIGIIAYSHIFITDEMIRLLLYSKIPARRIVIVFACCIAGYATMEYVMHSHNLPFITLVLIYVLTTCLTPYITRNFVWYQKVLGIITIIGILAANFIFYWNNEKENETRKLYAFKLTNRNDLNAEYHFRKVENKIAADPIVRDYFNNSIMLKSQLESIIRKSYFATLLGSYEVQLYDYDTAGNSYKENNNLSYNEVDTLYQYNTVKTVNRYFRYIKSTSDIQGYLAKFSYRGNGQAWGILYILLKPKIIHEENRFDELLVDGRNSVFNKPDVYAYAFYKTGRLLNHTGNYPYPIKLPNLENKEKVSQFFNEEGYSHLLYNGSNNITVVISKQQDNFKERVAIFSILFVVYTSLVMGLLLLFISLSISLNYLERHISSSRYIRYLHNFIISLQPMDMLNMRLISTRIQISIIIIVFPTLLLTFYFTIDSMIAKYEKAQADKLGKKTRSVVNAIENDPRLRIDDLSVENLGLFTHQVAEFNSTDITLFDLHGRLITTTTSRIYDEGLIAPFMNINALYSLHTLGHSQEYFTEEMGRVKFLAAYMPIQDSRKNVVAYLNMPYFVRESELYAEVTNLFISIINIYVIAFLSVIIIVYILSRNITAPLLLIRDKMASTSLGRKNELIEWKGNDEIAELVAQYNKMIEELARSAGMLARSERESAWREMAKQVAHEIKNPLTPMKLSVQHLQRAWNDKSQHLEETFKRVTAVLIEQIDSMSVLATEFSSFAKLPSGVMQPTNAIEVLHSVLALFHDTSHVQIKAEIQYENVTVLLDKDQLMRVFNNLLKNAIQSIPEEREGLVEVIVTLRHNELVVAISDNGSGIPTEEQSKIFLPNFSTKTSGMGLGLAIVKNILETTGGYINFETAAGGTTFYVTLPVQPDA